MRKLAPTVLFASIAALIGGTAFAATDTANFTSTDAVTGSPSAPANTSNPQGLSYSDKSNTSPGTNARMDQDAKPNGMASRVPGTRAGIAMDDDKTMTAKNSKHKANKHKAKMARSNDPDMMMRPQVDSSNGAAANSTTGTSPGGN